MADLVEFLEKQAKIYAAANKFPQYVVDDGRAELLRAQVEHEAAKQIREIVKAEDVPAALRAKIAEWAGRNMAYWDEFAGRCGWAAGVQDGRWHNIAKYLQDNALGL